MYRLNILKAVLRKIGIAPKFSMIQYRPDWPDPEIKFPNQVRITTKMGGICTSDLHQIAVSLSYFASILAAKGNVFPIGHECIGIIDSIGTEVHDLQIGDRVVLNPTIHCDVFGFHPCSGCEKGNWEACYTLTGIGDGSQKETEYGGHNSFGGLGGGGFGEKIIGMEKQFFKLPENIPDEVGVLIEPFAVGIHAVFRNPPQENETVVVFGAGIIGLMVIAAIRAYGTHCKIIAIARYPFQAEAAKRLGADEILSDRDPTLFYDQLVKLTNGRLFKPALGKRVLFGGSGPDLIYDCVVTETSMDDSIHLVRNNGRIIAVGLAYSVTKKIDWSIPIYKEIAIIGAMMHGVEQFQGEIICDFDLAIKFMSQNPSLFQGLVTHTFPISKYNEAIECAEKKGPNKAIKVAFKYE
jgi:threonine dehydrogenase-like Zn-dependent dehydrogenase